ncbi:MAG: AAA family ATPase [Acidimicrobiales bacterium]
MSDAAPSGQLVELAVTDLGIIEHVRLLFGPGCTALTGETGAGKTLLVGAIELLLGGRADPALVRDGCAEAVVEGRFDIDGDEVVLTRVVPADGRSRAYIDGRLATATSVGERARAIVDLHGQHDHQSLLRAAVQRDALDRFGAVDLAAASGASPPHRGGGRARPAGGDAGARARSSTSSGTSSQSWTAPS